jgi:putative ABC transport system substrate-binding protein
MRRREFIAGFGSAAAWLPAVARAQQTALPVIGVLNAISSVGRARELAAFRQGLNEGGYVEGRNVAIEYRSADAQYEQLPVLAADLVRRRVTVIAALGAPPAVAAKAVTTTIPIVFQVGADPVEMGLLASLSRPDGNITGVANLNLEVGPKKLQLLHQLVPTATIIGLLVNPANPNNEIRSRDMQAAARTLGVEVAVRRASTVGDIDEVFASLAQKRVGALVIKEVISQRRKPEGRFLLQVDRQTKTSFSTYEDAEKAGLVIKKNFPVVRVAIYDSVTSENKIIGG